MTLSVRPLTITAALAFVAEHHRRLPRCQGGMWAIGAERDGVLLGACVVGRPTARLLDDGRRLQVLRLAVVPGDASGSGQRGICSILYGAAARAARAMGASDLITYIHDDERGVSLRAAGWISMETTRGGQWSRRSRERAATVEPGPKVRWAAPWSACCSPGAAMSEGGTLGLRG